jgi:hypothetical protein
VRLVVEVPRRIHAGMQHADDLHGFSPDSIEYPVTPGGDATIAAPYLAAVGSDLGMVGDPPESQTDRSR